MIKETVYDKNGNLIYLTDERWNHIIEFHEEMVNHKQHLLKTLRIGKRRPDPYDPSLYSYYHKFEDLEDGFNHRIVVVKFGLTKTYEPNDFVLAAFQKAIYYTCYGLIFHVSKV
jgi:hypothetical protein